MGELMAHSVAVWESDPEAFHYHPVGYLAVAGDVQRDDFEGIAARHERIGYRARLVRGEQAVFDYMRALFPDWRARGLSVCLHEFQGGFAFNRESMRGLAQKAAGEGVRILPGVKVEGFEIGRGRQRADRSGPGPEKSPSNSVVAGVGPWVQQVWGMLDLPQQVDVRHDGALHTGLNMWTYWQLQEGEIRSTSNSYVTAEGQDAAGHPHRLERAAPGGPDRRGFATDCGGSTSSATAKGSRAELCRSSWGAKRRWTPTGRAARTTPSRDDFAEYWTAGLAHCMERFQGCSKALQARAHRGDRLLHRGQLPGVRLDAAQRLRHRRQQPRLQDDRRGQGGGARAHGRDAAACCTPSGSAVLPKATCTRGRAARFPGLDGHLLICKPDCLQPLPCTTLPGGREHS